MSRTLRFTELRVLRAPGFAAGGPTLESLSEGVNLVVGANASGKSTTARALQAVIWPGGASSSEVVEARLELDGAEWWVRVEAGRGGWQKEGQETSPPSFPPVENRSRYLLSLHELLQADDLDLAEAVRTASAGGWNLPGAAVALGLGPGASRPRKLLSAVKYARARLADAERKATGAQEAETQLEALDVQIAQLETAAGDAPVWESALELHDARAALGDVEARIAALPRGVEGVRDEDLDQARRRVEAMAAAEERVRDARARGEGATAELAELDFEESAPGTPTLSAVREHLQELRRADETLAATRVGLEEARTEATSAAQRLGFSGEPPAAEGVDLEGLHQLEEWLREAERVRAEREQLEAAHRSLKSEGIEGDPNALERERSLLLEWLRAPEPGQDQGAATGRVMSTAAILLFCLAAVVVGLALAGVVESDAAAFSVALVVAGVGVFLLVRRPAPAVDARGGVEERARRQGVTGPAWTPEGVERRLGELDQELAESRRRQGQARKLEELEREGVPRLEKAEAALKAGAETIAAAVGIDPSAEALSLFTLGRGLVAWHDAVRSVKALTAKLEAQGWERRRIHGELADLVAPWIALPEAVPEASAALGALEERARAHREATARRQAARKEEGSARARLSELEEERDTQARRLGVEASELVAFLEECAPHLASVRDAQQAKAGQEAVAARARKRLADLAAFGVPSAATLAHAGEIRPGNREFLEARLEEANTAKARLVELRERRGELRQEIEAARNAREVEAALAGLDEAQARLDEERRAQLRRGVGAALVNWLEEETREQERPRVFARASELLLDITGGRYELLVPDSADAPFRALDTVTGRGLALSELSSGTRIQVLLAVRIAFVDVHEAGSIALPLLLDEVLGNSDDQRARAIIEAVAALARSGRQIFYFTAQGDERSKWRAILAGREVPHREHALGRTPDGAEGFEWELDPSPLDLPDPAGATHAEYGRLLEVSPVDVWADEGVAALHLWHLVEDVEVLHSLLERGIERWGQFEALMRRGGAGLEEALREVAEQAERRAALAELVVRLRRVGRGRPVDRQVLEASGAVSDTFIDEMSARCADPDDLAGDGEALMKALWAGEFARFHNSKKSELGEYLAEAGYIDERSPFTDLEFLRELAVAAAGVSPPPSRAELVELARRLGRGPGALD